MAGLLDFLNTPTGMGLLSGVAGYAANARRGAPINSIGRGLAAGLQGYSQVNEDAIRKQQQAIDNDIRRQQQELLKFDYETRRKKLEAEQSEDMNASKLFNAMFTEAGYDPERGGFMQVSNEPQPIRSSPLPNPGESFGEKLISDVPATELSFTPPPPPKPANPFDDIYKELNWTPGRIKFFQTQLKASPESAMKDLRAAYVEADRANRKGRVEARDVLAKEKAIAEAMGIPVREYLRDKTSRSGVNVTVPVHLMAGEAGKKEASKEGWDIGEQAAMIENKYSAIDSIREAKGILKQGIYSGYWGDMGKTVAKASMGAVGDRQKAARTEEFMSYVGNTVVPRLKEFGGNDSNEEMKYLQRIMGGDTSMEPEAIANILDSAERKINLGIERLQRQRGALEKGRMPDLGPGPSRQQPVKPQLKPAPVSGVRRYNPATGRIE